MNLNFPWLHASFQHLYQQMATGGLHHALLLAGQANIGKSQLADAVAARLLCTGDQPDACGQCKSCLLMASGSHPDLTLLTTEEKSRFIKVDQVRAITEKLAGSAQQGGNKVVIVKRADQLNLNAANALLKSLEEPTPNTYFVMMADDLDRLLPTIISRCHVQRVLSPSVDQSRQWLQGYASNEAEVDTALHIARMSPLKALELLKAENGVTLPQIFEQLTLNASGRQTIGTTVKVLEKADLAHEVIPVLHSALRQAISRRMDARVECPPVVDKLAQTLLDKQWAINGYFELLDQCDKSVRLLTSATNPNPTLMVEDLLIRLAVR